MKYNLSLTTLLFVFLCILQTSCLGTGKDKKDKNYRDSEKWGQVTDRKINTGKAVSALKICGICSVNITQSDTFSIICHGNDKAIDAYLFDFDGESLSITRNDNILSGNANIPSITINIYAPDVNDICVSGNCNLEFKNEVKTDNSFRIKMEGHGDVELGELECENLEVILSGHGELKTKAVRCNNKAEFLVDGAGDIDSKIRANSISVTMTGAGDAELSVKCNNLYANVAGKSDLTIKGECVNFRKTESGKGAINSKELHYNNKNAIFPAETLEN